MSFTNATANQQLLKDFRSIDLSLKASASKQKAASQAGDDADSVLLSKTLVLTETLPKLSRSGVKLMFEKVGDKVSAGVRKNRPTVDGGSSRQKTEQILTTRGKRDR